MTFRHLAALSLPLLLAACATETADGSLVLEDGELYLPLGEDASLQWDDPSYRPDVDRWAPNGTPVSIPLGSTNAFNVTDATWKGESDNDQLGISVAAVGDLNADGLEDMAMGSLWASGTAEGDGAAYMNRASYKDGNYRADASKGRWYGESGSAAGEQVAGGGDVDGDGQDDFLIGAKTHEHATDAWKTKAGAAWLVFGFDRGKNTLPSGATMLEGTKAYEFAGVGVDIAGDLNGDGYADILVGASGADTNGAESGCVYIINGPVTADMSLADADGEVGGENAGDGIGSRVVGLGDIDGDGIDDFAVGARNEGSNGENAGAVYVITSGTLPATVADADIILRGNKEDSNGGSALSEAGDLDGDGTADYLVGALGHNGFGAAYVMQGSVTSGKLGEVAYARFTGQLAGDQFGSSLTSGDVDGDGNEDVVVGANRQGTNDRGAVYVFAGPVSGSVQAYEAASKISGVAASDYFGSSVDFAENTRVDGKDSLIVGASARGTTDKGAVYFFLVP
ncbi:MAG: integrin alpha [Myxococcota bacterium]|nr:integrin alpha [Myxococcota bacterium]